jgi:hypothetical protein
VERSGTSRSKGERIIIKMVLAPVRDKGAQKGIVCRDKRKNNGWIDGTK